MSASCGLYPLHLISLMGVTLAAFALTRNLLLGVPLTFDFSLWFAGYGLFFVLLVLALAVWGFWAARGGGALFGAVSLDD